MDDERVLTLSAGAERFLLRLMVVADDYLRFIHSLPLLKSRLFPLSPNIRETDIALQIAECVQAGVLRCYVADDGRSYLKVLVNGQRKKWMKSIHPDEPDQQPMLLGLPAGPPVKPKKRESRESRVERESNTHTHGSASPKEPLADALAQDVAAGSGNMVTAPSLQQVLAYAAGHGVTPESAQNFFEYHDGNDLWRNQHGRPIPWQKKLISWARKDESQGGLNSLKNNGKHCKSGPNRNADTFNQSLRDGHNGEPGGTSGKPAPDAGFR